ncbi:MAG: hypothetical protein K0R15_1136 [Clostridiales bacterium]|jgi:ATP/maltotriose-dependent transcriptional regulator MalT|nr:hypothetical protein [Clostridiales bacterium]
MNESTIIAIILIVVGLAVVFISFIFSEKYLHKDIDKQDDMAKLSNSFLVKQEEEIANMANKKMAAINEYYTFVIEEIEKKHKELLFLYHMISEKDNELKKGIQNVGNIMNDFVVEKEKFIKQNEIQSTSQAAEFYNVKGNNEQNKNLIKSKPNKEIKNENTDNKILSKDNNIVQEKVEFTSNNEIILDLYAQGSSVKEIASKLGLGIGEVKLVIDLFSEVRL